MACVMGNIQFGVRFLFYRDEDVKTCGFSLENQADSRLDVGSWFEWGSAFWYPVM